MCSIIGVGERLHEVLGQIDLAHWTQVSDRCPLGYLFSLLSQFQDFVIIFFVIVTLDFFGHIVNPPTFICTVIYKVHVLRWSDHAVVVYLLALEQKDCLFDSLLLQMRPYALMLNVDVELFSLYDHGGARWLSGRVSDSGARGPGFETYRRRVVSLSKTLYSPKVLVNYPGSDGSVPT